MLKIFLNSLIVISVCFGLFLTAAPASAATCTATGYLRDGINLTAAYIDTTPAPGTVVDATGCHIGVYYAKSAVLDGVEINGATYFGVLVNGNTNNIKVDISNSKIHNIGETPFNGAQHGVAVYYTGAATGTVSRNSVYAYQKGGITVDGTGADVAVTRNTVTGLGRVGFIAQNGIQFGRGAKGTITDNKVSGNFYWCRGKQHTCDNGWISAGILLYQPDPSLSGKGAAAELKEENTLFDNQVNVMIVK